MTSYLVVEEGQQKQDVLYGDNATSGVIMEENALQRNASSGDQRNVTLSSFPNLDPAHARVAREPHPCVDYNEKLKLVPCDGNVTLTQISCRKVSLVCTHRESKCDKQYTACTINGELEHFVTGCDCR